MNRSIAVVLVAGIALALAFSPPESGAQTAPLPPPGPPGSGVVTGGTAPTVGDVIAALDLLLGLQQATPGEVAALDLNDDGQLALGDVVTLLRVVVGLIPLPQRPAPPSTGPPQTLKALGGWLDGSAVLYVVTDDSTAAGASARQVNFAPALANATMSGALKPVYELFTNQGGMMMPVPGQGPVFSAGPSDSDYTPIWRVNRVVVVPDYKAGSLTSSAAITGDKGPSAGGSVVSVEQTDELVNAPILFVAGGSGPRHPYVTPSASFSADATSVTLPGEPTLYDGNTYMMVAADTADAGDAKTHQSNFAPALATLDPAAIAFYVVLGPDGKPTQDPVLAGAPEPPGPTSTNADYTPLWRLTTVQWSSSVASPPKLLSDDDVKARLASGDLKTLPGGFVFDCPVVAQTTAPPPQPPPGVAVTIQNFSFQPKDITVPVGTTVTWTNMDPVGHTVTSGPPGKPDGLFDSGTLSPGQTFAFTFTKTGTFPYFCVPHFSFGMVGSVTVK